MKRVLLSFYAVALTAIFCLSSQASNKLFHEFSQRFFDDYAVQTALDMVNVIPGFQADFGESVRGLSGGGGNILIDGKRPSVKSGDISDILSNIPAQDVAKIELIVGSSGSGDAAEKSNVINIIRAKSASSLRIEGTENYVDESRVQPKLLVNYSGHWNQWRFQVDSLYNTEKIPTLATVDTFDATDFGVDRYVQSQVSDLDEYTLTTNVSRQYDKSELAIYNKLKWSRYQPLTKRRKNLQQLHYFLNDRDSAYIMGELGIDYDVELSNQWRSRWQGIFLVNHWDVERLTLDDIVSDIGSHQRRYDYVFDRNKTETILKSTWRNSALLFNPEFGVEVAHNKSKFTTDYSKVEHGVREPITLAAANVMVEELRGDVFVRGLHKLSSQFSLNFAMAAEYSKLSVSGGASNQQNYVFAKPSVALVYSSPNRWTWQTQIARSVGQLNFKLFAAQSNQVDNRNTAGNPSIKPDTKVRLTSQINYSFSSKGAIKLEIFRDWRKDVLEQIVLPSGDIGIGNSGDASVVGLSSQLTLPIDYLLPKGLLSIDAQFTDGDYRDLSTGVSRQLTATKQPDVNVSIRQDNTWYGLSWGATYTLQTTTDHFYISEYNQVAEDGIWAVYIEKEMMSNWRLRLDANTLGRALNQSTRYFYPQHRAQEVSHWQRRSIQNPWRLALSLSVVI